MFSGLRCLSYLFALIFTALCFLPTMVIAAPPGAAFNGGVSEIFVNDTQILLTVSGTVTGSCSGRWGSYNLTFNISDPGAEFKFSLIQDAFLNGKKIAGFVKGCGSSNINKLSQVSIY
ncbi:MAG: hypothetical protein VSS75_003890 [Candidatus Parabeggiatoa sp.]|nr:hypothetical protein [Candidatus Parabeggiatoa sp.]